MKLQRKGTRHSHRGVIGVESAIVMIAFVIVAAALAFVVLNMGFTTSQKAKTTIISGL
ncbi:MAG: flagellin, partial [Nitrosopumilus sp.]|nr:flagellin [Nitrosopumilus sp.]